MHFAPIDEGQFLKMSAFQEFAFAVYLVLLSTSSR